MKLPYKLSLATTYTSPRKVSVGQTSVRPTRFLQCDCCFDVQDLRGVFLVVLRKWSVVSKWILLGLFCFYCTCSHLFPQEEFSLGHLRPVKLEAATLENTAILTLSSQRIFTGSHNSPIFTINSKPGYILSYFFGTILNVVNL